MKTSTLKQALEEHNARVNYPKTDLKLFISGSVLGILAWEAGAWITDIIISAISK